MSGKPWEGWVCGNCKVRLDRREVCNTIPPSQTLLHEIIYTADYAGDQPRHEYFYCGPVRHYPRKDK